MKNSRSKLVMSLHLIVVLTALSCREVVQRKHKGSDKCLLHVKELPHKICSYEGETSFKVFLHISKILKINTCISLGKGIS